MTTNSDVHFGPIVVCGPYPLCSIFVDVLGDALCKREGGVYLWCVKQTAGHYLVTYVGETGTSFYQRNKEHVVRILGGDYEILDAELMRNGVRQLLWAGLWRKDRRNCLPEWMSRYCEMNEKAKAYVEAIEVFLVPFEANRRWRRDIEADIARQIRATSESASLFPADIRYVRAALGEETIQVPVECVHPILGIPAECNVRARGL